MKQRLIFLITAFLIANIINSQDFKFSTTLSYPLPVGDNFVKQYNGVLDIGVQYRFLKAGAVNIGASANASYLNFGYSENDPDPDARRNAYFVQPRIFGELDLENLAGFKPSLGVGYTYVNFAYKNGRQTLDIPKVDYNGYHINFSATYDFNDWFFAIIQYEFVKIANDIGDNINYNTNLGFLKFGVGARF